jgi:MFS family permease
MKDRSWLALWVTLAAQALVTFQLSIAPVIAPAVAPTLGIDPSQVGVFTAVAYVFAVLTGAFFGPWIDRIGPVRFTCFAVLSAGVGGLLSTGGSALLLVSAALVGAGYGGTNPSAAAILGRHAPARSAGFFFALKQTGVPLGVALAGLTMTVAVASLGWRLAVSVASVVAIGCALLILRTAPLLEERDRARTTQQVSAWSSLREVVTRPELRRLSLMSLAYAMAQQAFVTYVVSLLVARGLPLSTAGAMLAASQVASVIVRVSTGHVSDKWIEPRTMLAGLGFSMALACAGLALLPDAPPLAWVAVLMLFAGATTMGWNGVFFAQLVRIVPREDLAKTAGGTQAFTFGGATLGPFFFALLLREGYSYTLGYLAFGSVAALAALAMAKRSQ